MPARAPPALSWPGVGVRAGNVAADFNFMEVEFEPFGMNSCLNRYNCSLNCHRENPINRIALDAKITTTKT